MCFVKKYDIIKTTKIVIKDAKIFPCNVLLIRIRYLVNEQRIGKWIKYKLNENFLSKMVFLKKILIYNIHFSNKYKR